MGSMMNQLLLESDAIKLRRTGDQDDKKASQVNHSSREE
jgi:hypothetical protein